MLINSLGHPNTLASRVTALAKLENFDDNQRHIVVGEGATSPRHHAVQDRLLQFRNRSPCRSEDKLFKPFDSEHVAPAVEDLDEPVGVESQTVAGCKFNFIHRFGRHHLGETTENAALRIE